MNLTRKKPRETVQAFSCSNVGYATSSRKHIYRGNKCTIYNCKFWWTIQEKRRRQHSSLFRSQTTCKENGDADPKQPFSNTSVPKSRQDGMGNFAGNSTGNSSGNGGNNLGGSSGREDNSEDNDSPSTLFYDASENTIDPDLKGVLRAYKVSLDSLPDDLKRAIQAGVISRSTLSYFLLQLKNPFLGWALVLFRSFRNRVLADKEFLYKVLVQEIVGNGTALIGEVMVRKKEILDEMEYVLSDMIVGIVVEATFVWLLAPANPFPTLQNTSHRHYLWNMISQLPANMFEAATPNRPYSISQRCLSFLWSGIQYSVIGIVAGLVGTGLTYSMLQIRKQFQPNYRAKRRLPPIIANSLGWGAYMFVSANPRFQLVEGLERLCGILLMKRFHWLMKFCIFVLRFGNNLYGGIQFVQFFRALGLQSTEELQP